MRISDWSSDVCSSDLESARKLQDLACEHTLALGYGILPCENDEQAWARADVNRKNKGGDAAQACLAMLDVKTRSHLFPRCIAPPERDAHTLVTSHTVNPTGRRPRRDAPATPAAP